MSSGLEISLLDSLEIRFDGELRQLPKSRQTRALLAYLLLSPAPRRREYLARLLWEGASDPRAGLRWSLTKLRPLLSMVDGHALVADRDEIWLDRSKFVTDLEQVEGLVADESTEPAVLTDVGHRFGDEPLPGLDQEGATEYRLWLESERQRLHGLHRRLLIRLAQAPALDPTEALRAVRKAVALDPYDIQGIDILLRLTLAHTGRARARQELDQARLCWVEAGIDPMALSAVWQALSSKPAIRVVPVEALLAPADDETMIGGQPSIAVLDFSGFGGDGPGDIFAEGLASDLSSQMAQLRGLFVIARASAARFSPSHYSIPEIGRRLGVRYLLHGSTRRQNSRLRVTVELVETARGAQVWSEHFDRALDDLFMVQDDITGAVISTLLPEIERAEMERARLKPPESLDAWECFHRALWHSFRFTARDTELALGFLDRALVHDSNFARAHAGRSFAHFSRAFLGSVPEVNDEISHALKAAHQCVDLDGRDAMGHWALGRALFLAREHDQALAALERCVEVNPNYAQGHYARGFVGTHSGYPDMALEELETAQRLSPFDPLLFAIKSTRGLAFAVQGRFEEAADWAVRATQEPNAHFHIQAIAAGCLALAERDADAKRLAEGLYRSRPGYSIVDFERSFPHKLDDHRRILRAALLKAGLRER